jgi:O2-independent ubiquinone biosynthesis accessory factor UbiT
MIALQHLLPPVPSPAALLRPAQWLPHPLVEALVARVTGHLLHEALADHALDLLEGRILAIRILDPEIRLRFTLAEERIRSADAGLPDVTITAAADDLLLLVAQRADPDTLFFHRRLRIAGDTELGLAVKNVLDTIDLGALPSALRRALGHLADEVEQRRKGSAPRSARMPATPRTD